MVMNQIWYASADAFRTFASLLKATGNHGDSLFGVLEL
jgi:hypothetical protein